MTETAQRAGHIPGAKNIPWARAVNEDGTFSHTGSDGTAAWVDPNEDLIVLVFTQTPRGANPRQKFLELVRSAIRR